jgi:hypothetical protein
MREVGEELSSERGAFNFPDRVRTVLPQALSGLGPAQSLRPGGRETVDVMKWQIWSAEGLACGRRDAA